MEAKAYVRGTRPAIYSLPGVGKLVAQNHLQQPKRALFYILLGAVSGLGFTAFRVPGPSEYP